MSILIFIISIAAGVYGFVSLQGADFKPAIGSYQVSWNVPSNAAFGYALIVAAIFGATVAILGFCAVCTMSYCCAIPLGIISFVTGLIFFVAGVAVLALNVADILDKQVCGGLNGLNFI